MAGILSGVDQRTNLVGENRMELLLFRLGPRKQRYGINVFKVQEVIQCPPLTRVAHSNPVVCGITNMRGRTITILDLAKAIGKKGIEDVQNAFVIITEYNRSVQGFLVEGVERIVNLNWDEIKAPPKGLGKDSYMTAVTNVDGDLVEIIDVEKVLAELIGTIAEIDNPEQMTSVQERPINVLVVDDSSVARNQIKRTLEQMGVHCTLGVNGRDGLTQLQELSEEGNISDYIDLVISDVEMPEMDGYTLTTEIRHDEKLKHLPIILHTSLSGQFNSNMVQKVGADKFVSKFNAEDLSSEVVELLKSRGLVVPGAESV